MEARNPSNSELSTPLLADSRMPQTFVNCWCYMHGKIVNGVNGVSYDGNLVKALKLDLNWKYEELQACLCKSLRVDLSSHKLVIKHRCPSVTGNTVWYAPVPIVDDDDVVTMFDFAMTLGRTHVIELYLEVSEVSLNETDTELDGSQPDNHLGFKVGIQQSLLENPQVNMDVDPIVQLHKSVDDLENSEHSGEEDLFKDVALNVHEGEGDAVDLHLHVPMSSPYIPKKVLPISTHGSSSGNPIPFYSMFDDSAMSIEDDFSHESGIEDVEDINDLRKGILFDSKQEVQKVVKKLHILNQQELVVVESDKRIWDVKCKLHEGGCKWRLRACKKKKHGLFEITRYIAPHTCDHQSSTQGHAQLDSNIIASQVVGRVATDPSVRMSVLSTVVKDIFGYEVSMKKIWAAKKKAIELVYGSWEGSYNELPHLMNALKVYNPGTKVEWMTYTSNAPNEIFQRVWWAFKPCIDAFNYCRPVLQIDASFLYGKYQGKLLVASAVDGMNHILPLAFAVVEEESRDSWSWFLQFLRHHVTQRQGICLIFDQNEYITAAVTDPSVGWSEPQNYHRSCVQHVGNNFNKQHNSAKLKEKHLVNERHMNGVLKGCRQLPITAMVKLIFYRCVEYFDRRRVEIEQQMKEGHSFTAYANKKVTQWATKASEHTVNMIDHDLQVFEIVTHKHNDKGGNKQTVHLDNGTCTCGKWQCYYIPCSHIIACCTHTHTDYHRFISHWYHLDNAIKCYESKFEPLRDREYWPACSFPKLHHDPSKLRKKGRPKSIGIRHGMDFKESSLKSNCGICRQEGHNRRRCPLRDAVQPSSSCRN